MNTRKLHAKTRPRDTKFGKQATKKESFDISRCLSSAFYGNPSKASIFNTVKNDLYPDHLPCLLQGSHMVPLPLSPSLLVHAVHPSTMCARCVVTSSNIGGFSATIWRRKERHMRHVAVEKGNLTMQDLDSLG